MPNVNCLKGIKCPKCDYRDHFHIAGEAMFKVTDDGTEDYGDVEWNGDSVIRCGSCSHIGRVKEFTTSRKKKENGPGRFVEPDRCNAAQLLGWIARVAHMNVGETGLKGYFISDKMMKRVKELAVDPATG